MTAEQKALYNRVYVWEFPVRLYHWLNGITVTLLIISGFLIGNPIRLFYANEAYQQYWFGTVRFIHFVSAYIFFFNFLVRIYWGFVGNTFARWSNFIPLKKKQWREIGQVLKVDILLADPSERMSVGHNSLAGFVYFLTFLAFAFQSLTGFALYSANSTSFFPRLFTWVIPLFGGDMAVRQWHHVFMWFFIVFIIIHLYLVFYHDYIEGRGTTSSMVGGWKFEKDEDLKNSND
ncbi:MAG TPA: Ni/Fe-hydrogenase, b-type cytochrome subunit [Caldithrix abyssi]|uniref:Ni/Fe-hydrogenase, b-type cytochrome subunit n=1 Tax=Caldithrix abyssi TaxID=187145 RepID=A0A7V1PUC1_CALAY|nr:Ni/Fe-hydrogenase, b-type cytochrome subunit [Caldithrix abyssi]